MADHSPTEVEQHEHQTWESTAEVYADTVGFMTAQSGQAEIIIAAGDIDDHCEVLDVGCGPGQLSVALAEVASHVEGIDFSAQMVEAARTRYPQLTFNVANAEQMPFDDASFDAAVCNYTAHHFARPQLVFTEILRVLKPGGRVVVVHPVQSEQAAFGSFAQALYEHLPADQVPGGPLLDVADPADYEALLADCGYARVQAEKRLKPVNSDSIEPLLTAGWKIGDLASQPQDIQDKIRAGTLARAKQFQTADGTYSFPDVVIVASGRKPG